MPIDEDLLTLVPTAVVLILFLLAFFSVLIDFESKKARAEQVQAAISIAQAIALNSSGLLKQADLPAVIAVNSTEYKVQVNLTNLETGESWFYGASNGSAVTSLPILIEKVNGVTSPAKLFVRVGK